MKRFIVIAALAAMLALPASSFALGLELAVGGWGQSPSGTVGYKALTQSDKLDLESDAKYDDETRLIGRAKLDLPMFLPNIYFMATPMEFDGTGRKTSTFKFGDRVFDLNADFYSKVVLDHYDIALYYGIPGLQTATAGVLNVEFGLNARIIDYSAEVRGQVAGVTESESDSATLVVPMVYLGAQVRPVDWLSIEAEVRGIAYSGNHYYDYIGRLKAKPVGPFFVAVGWRAEDLVIDEEDVDAEIDVSGPFAEIGIEF